MFTSTELATLANAFGEATGRSLASLGHELFDDHQFFKRLNQGMDCRVSRAAAASQWFVENWPEGRPWPEGVPSQLSQSDRAAE